MTQVALPGLAEECPISSEQKAQYRRDGHILLQGVASPTEIAAFLSLIRAAVSALNPLVYSSAWE